MQYFSDIKPTSKLLLSASLSIAFVATLASNSAFAKDEGIEFTPGKFRGGFSRIEIPDDQKENNTLKDEDKLEDESKDEDSDEEKEEEEPPALESKDSNVYLKRARVFVKHKLYKKALKEVNNSLSLNKNNWDARYLGAFILQIQGRNDEAIKHYRKLLFRKPDYLLARINLGSLLREKHLYKQAEAHYRKAIEIKFYSLMAHYNLANLMIEQNKLQEALKELKICKKIAPNNARVHNNLGVLYQKRNYIEEAEEEFLRANTLEPGNKTYATNLKLLRGHQETREAQADFSDLL